MPISPGAKQDHNSRLTTEKATIFAFLESEASVVDKLRVLDMAGRCCDTAMLEAKQMLEKEGTCPSHARLFRERKTYVSVEYVLKAGKPSLGDAIAAATNASSMHSYFEARESLDSLHKFIDQGEISASTISEELQRVAQSFMPPFRWAQADPKEAYLKRERTEPGIQFFVPAIDQITMGCPPGKVATIAAFTGQGKSTFLKNMAYLNAMHHGVDGPFLTLEDSPDDVMMSFVVRHSLDPKWKGRPPLVNTPTLNAALSEEDKAFYMEVADDWVNGNHAQIKVCGMEHLGGDYSIGSVISLIKSFRPYKAVYIDYMNVFKTFDVPGTRGEYERINFATSMIRNEICLAKTPVPLAQCAQINRTGYNKYLDSLEVGLPGGYNLSDLSEANELEKGSAFVIALFLNESLRNSHKINVQLLKGRGSAIMDTPFEVGFAPQYFLVGESAEDYGRATPGRAPVNIDDLTKDDG